MHVIGGLLVTWALDAARRRPTVTISYTAAAASMLGCAGAAATGSKTLVLVAFTVETFFATCAWVSAYPTFSKIFQPTCVPRESAPESEWDGRGRLLGRFCWSRSL
jgi:hypothetical protein